MLSDMWIVEEAVIQVEAGGKNASAVMHTANMIGLCEFCHATFSVFLVVGLC